MVANIAAYRAYLYRDGYTAGIAFNKTSSMEGVIGMHLSSVEYEFDSPFKSLQMKKVAVGSS